MNVGWRLHVCYDFATIAKLGFPLLNIFLTVLSGFKKYFWEFFFKRHATCTLTAFVSLFLCNRPILSHKLWALLITYADPLCGSSSAYGGEHTCHHTRAYKNLYAIFKFSFVNQSGNKIRKKIASKRHLKKIALTNSKANKAKVNLAA